MLADGGELPRVDAEPRRLAKAQDHHHRAGGPVSWLGRLRYFLLSWDVVLIDSGSGCGPAVLSSSMASPNLWQTNKFRDGLPLGTALCRGLASEEQLPELFSIKMSMKKCEIGESGENV
jgi:hypothetical protein